MSDDLYTECLDDAQKLLGMAQDKLSKAEYILRSQRTTVRLAAGNIRNIQIDIKTSSMAIDELPVLPVEKRK